MYTRINFRTKKELKQALKDGHKVYAYQPEVSFCNDNLVNGTHCLEGPHYPEPHRWYATAQIKEGIVVSVK